MILFIYDRPLFKVKVQLSITALASATVCVTSLWLYLSLSLSTGVSVRHHLCGRIHLSPVRTAGQRSTGQITDVQRLQPADRGDPVSAECDNNVATFRAGENCACLASRYLVHFLDI